MGSTLGSFRFPQGLMGRKVRVSLFSGAEGAGRGVDGRMKEHPKPRTNHQVLKQRLWDIWGTVAGEDD